MGVSCLLTNFYAALGQHLRTKSLRQATSPGKVQQLLHTRSFKQYSIGSARVPTGITSWTTQNGETARDSGKASGLPDFMKQVGAQRLGQSNGYDPVGF